MVEIKGWLVVFDSDKNELAEFELREGKNFVGSSPEAHIFLPENGIEKFHFSVRVGKEKASVVDLDSDTGIFYVNGERFFRHEFKDEFGFKTSEFLFIIKIV